MRYLLITLLAAAPLTGPASPSQTPEGVVFSDVAVLPMDEEQVLSHRDVLVQRSIIRSIDQHRPNRPWPADTIVVHGAGKYLIPGLSDMHIHTQFGDEQQLKLYIVNGVTAVLNLSGSPQLLGWKDRIASGAILDPTFFSSGPILDGDPPTTPSHMVVRNREEAARQVEEQSRQGYDFVKPYSALSSDAYDGIVDAARRNHIRVVGHVPWSVGVEGVINANQDAIAHVEELYRYFVDRHEKPPPDTRPDPARIKALAKQLADHRIWVITTLSANSNILKQATHLSQLIESLETRFIPKSYLAECRTDDPYAKRGSDWVLQNEIMVPFLFEITAGLRAAGVQMMAGTDATNPIQVPGVTLHDELEQLVQAGLTPFEALVTATRNPAMFLGRLQEAGTVTPGTVADLVLLDSNPLENISNTRRIAGVLLRGRWLDHAQLESIKQDLVAHFAME
ncbi:MAG TPA: amidohydrolase family protein [Vicinamibacteria bacterium]|nr:amidohydrolase family protein [Vicinamibacteria bacterium]